MPALIITETVRELKRKRFVLSFLVTEPRFLYRAGKSFVFWSGML